MLGLELCERIIPRRNNQKKDHFKSSNFISELIFLVKMKPRIIHLVIIYFNWIFGSHLID